MYVLITIYGLYYHGPINTYLTHADAFKAGVISGSWFDIEQLV